MTEPNVMAIHPTVVVVETFDTKPQRMIVIVTLEEKLAGHQHLDSWHKGYLY